MDNNMGSPRASPSPVPVVYFFCVGNTIRSQMAEGFLRQRASGAIEVHSAGTDPLGYVLPETVQVMREVGIDIRHQTSDPIQDDVLARATALIDLGGRARSRLPPETHPRLTEWPIDDPYGRGLLAMRATRDAIGRRVDEWLVRHLPLPIVTA